MNAAQQAAGLAWLDAWAGPMIANAPFYERSAIQSMFQAYRQTIVDGILGAALAVPTQAAFGTGSGPITDVNPDGGQGT